MTPPAAAAAAPAVRPAPARRSRPRHVTAPVGRPRHSESILTRRLLDQTMRSRIWIAFVAFALIGIVAMQLWLLKLNTGIGRAIEHESLLQRTNSALSAEDSAMSAGDLVERQAIADGMTIVPPGALLFLHVHGALDERQAAARLAQPVSAGTSAPSAPTSTTTPTTTAEAGGQAAAQSAAQSASPPSSTPEVTSTAATPEATSSAAAPQTTPTVAPQPEAQAQG
jgi:hypothetical protein